MSQTRTSAVNVKFDLCLSLKLHELSHFSIPHPATPFKAFRSIWNTPLVIPLHFTIFISFLKHTSHEGVFRLAQISTGLHVMQVKIRKHWHDPLENKKTKCYCIGFFGSLATRRDLHNNNKRARSGESYNSWFGERDTGKAWGKLWVCFRWAVVG